MKDDVLQQWVDLMLEIAKEEDVTTQMCRFAEAIEEIEAEVRGD